MYFWHIACIICHGEDMSSPDMFVIHSIVPGLRTGQSFFL